MDKIIDNIATKFNYLQTIIIIMHSLCTKNGKSKSHTQEGYSLLDQYSQQMLDELYYSQEQTFRMLHQKCDSIETGVESIEAKMRRFQQKIVNIMEIVSSQKMKKLKEQQYQFIQNETNKKIRKLEEENQQLETQLMAKQQECIELISHNQKLAKQNLELVADLDKKSIQLVQLKNNIRKQKQSEVSVLDKGESSPTFKKVSEYEKLETQLQDLERIMSAQIQSYKNKNTILQKQIKELSQKLQDSNNHTKDSNKTYELQYKLKNIQQQYRQLQEHYQEQVNKGNKNQLQFHKRITELKNMLSKEKKMMKSFKSENQRYLKKLVEDVITQIVKETKLQPLINISKKVIFVGARTPQQQYQQIKNILVRFNKKIINSIILQNNFALQQKNVEIDSKNNMIKSLNTHIDQLKQKLEKQKFNNSLTNQSIGKNNSVGSANSDHQKQKEENKKIRVASTQINQLREELSKVQEKLAKQRRLYDEEEAKFRDQILQKQTKLYQLTAQLQFSKQLSESRLQQMQQNIYKYKKEIEVSLTTRQEKQKQYEQNISNQKLQLLHKEDQIKTGQRKIRALEKKLGEHQKKYTSKQQKMSKAYNEMKKKIENKEKIIEQLINKNLTLNIECKLLKQKNSIMEFAANDMKQNLKDYENKMREWEVARADSVTQQLQTGNKKAEQLLKMVQQLQKQKNLSLQEIESRHERQQKLRKQHKQIKREKQSMTEQIKNLEDKNRILEQHLNSQKQKSLSQEKNNLQKLQQKYQSKLLKTRNQIQHLQKEIQKTSQISHKLSILQQQHQKLKEGYQRKEKEELQIKYSFDVQKFKYQSKFEKIIKQNEQQISKLTKKIEQLEQSHSKNSFPSLQIKNLSSNKIKKTQSIQFQQTGINTSFKKNTHAHTNTQPTADLNKTNKNHSKLQNKILNDSSLNLNQSSSKVSLPKKQEKSELRNSNLFNNLKMEDCMEDQDAFEICDEEEAVNFGQSAVNLQIRQLFNTMRTQIEKLFNEEDISMSMIKLLPPALQDDYFQFTAYVKQKIFQIKNNNEISFIMAEPGKEPDQPLQESFDFPELIQRHKSENELEYRKIIQQKDAMIMSLMTQKNSQQNTINQLTQQKQQIEQENENRFMNQCNIYKRQIKEHKKMLDTLEMKYQSFKNVIKNILESYSSNEDLEDDFRDSMTVYARMAKLNEKDRTRINYHIQRFRELKGLQ